MPNTLLDFLLCISKSVPTSFDDMRQQSSRLEFQSQLQKKRPLLDLLSRKLFSLFRKMLNLILVTTKSQPCCKLFCDQKYAHIGSKHTSLGQ